MPATVAVEHGEAARLAVQVVSFAELPRLTPAVTARRPIVDRLADALDAFASKGVGRGPAEMIRLASTPEELIESLRELRESIEESPMPESEWLSVAELLGEELTVALVGISSTSLQRYRSQLRATPDDVAARLHFVALIVAALAGSYNEIGIRRWFGRARTALDGARPMDLLRGEWSPQEEGPRSVRQLADALLASPAT